MTITSEKIRSTDDRFTMNDLNLGDNYKPLDVYFKSSEENTVRRSYAKGEQKIKPEIIDPVVPEFQGYRNQYSSVAIDKKLLERTC